MRSMSLVVLVGCGVGAERVEQAETLSFRSVEAVEGSRLSDCPDAFLDALRSPAALDRVGDEGTLRLVGEDIAVVFHDGEDGAGAFPEDFAQSYVTEGFEWWLAELETPWNLVVKLDGDGCAVAATYAP